MARAFFAELKPLADANSVRINKNNVKANIWTLYMKFEANKEFMENLSLQYAVNEFALWIMSNTDATIPYSLIF